MYRTHNLGELRIENVNQEVELSGWVQKIRNLGGMIFIDLRDQFGITQIVINDEKMQETVDSIKEYGVLNPCIVRPREGGGYEIISGHRRKYACQLAGKAKIPAIIRNYTDDEATIIMVDSVRP